MTNLLRFTSHFSHRIRRPISNKWALVTLFTVFSLCLHRLFFKISLKPAGDWQGPATLYGYIYQLGLLPMELLESNVLFWGLKIIFLISLIGWFTFRRWRITAMFGSFLFFTLACSHHLENIPRASSHTGNILSLSLFAFYLAHLFDLKGLNEKSLSEFSRDKTTSYLLPFTLKSLLFLIYSISGFTKISRSGLKWPNSENMQTFLHYFASKADNLELVQIALDFAPLAGALGIAVLLLESLAFLGIFNEVLGVFIGTIFIAFHLSITYLFGWTFFSHVFLLILVASPLSLVWLNPNKSSPPH